MHLVHRFQSETVTNAFGPHIRVPTLEATLMFDIQRLCILFFEQHFSSTT
jgi:hypothetical protein